MVREACKWVLGMRHFDVQLGGGMVPNEGKTLVATVPMFHNALMSCEIYSQVISAFSQMFSLISIRC